MNTHTLLKITLCVAALGTTVGCGSQNFGTESGVANSSSRLLDDNSSSEKSALCSGDVAGQSDFKARVRAVSLNDVINYNVVRVKLPKIPAEFASKGLDLSFYKWQVNREGASDISDKVLEYQFEVKTAAGYKLIHPAGNNYTVFNMAEVKTMAEHANYYYGTNLGYATGADFFSEVNMIVSLVNDPQEDGSAFDAIRVVFHDPETGASVRELDVLLPPFHPDPAEYRKDHPSILPTLHPLKAFENQGWSEKELLSKISDYCF